LSVRSFVQDLVYKSSGKIKKQCSVCRSAQKVKSDNRKESRVNNIFAAANHVVTSVHPKSVGFSPTSPRKDQEVVKEEYCHYDIYYLTRLGVSSFAEVTDELLLQADPEVSRYFRSILCEAQAEDESINNLSDLIPRSDARYSDMGKTSSVKSRKLTDTSKSSSSDDDTDTVSSEATVKKLMKRRRNKNWIREAFLQIADFLSHLAMQILKNPFTSLAVFVAIYFFIFNGVTAKIFLREFTIGLAKATEKAITSGDKSIDYSGH